MKVLLYVEAPRLLKNSGVGRALEHQKRALDYAGVEWTTDDTTPVDVAHFNTVGPGAQLALNRCRRNGIPVVYSTHTTREDFRNSMSFSNVLAPIVGWRVKSLYSSADQLICPSEYAMGVVREHGVEAPAQVISNGVDTEHFRYDSERADAFLKEYRHSKPLILSVGLPFKRKGVTDFCEVAESLPDYNFIWLGARMMRVLPREVRRVLTDPPANVLFPGYVPDELIVGAYSACDVFFFPTYEENEGIVVLEALSTERPILLRDIPVYQGWMQDGVNCRKARDNREFAKLLREMVERPEEARELGARGRATAQERDLHVVGEKLKALYSSLLDRKPTATSSRRASRSS
ncbi:MAG: glycosyltransferase [Candidatus Bipolaricaulota bacterium]